jgi:hypothetical protein
MDIFSEVTKWYMARYATKVTSDDPRKKSLGVCLGIFVAMQLVPYTHPIAQEELHLSSFTPLQQNELVFHPAESKTGIYWEGQFIRIWCQHTRIIQQLEITFGVQTFSQECYFEECFHVFRTTLLLLG